MRAGEDVMPQTNQGRQVGGDLSAAAAAALLLRARRIVIIGCSGGGKSTLAARLSSLLHLPHLSMDREVLWLPGWKLRPREDMRQLLEELVSRESWIIEGNSPATLALRLARTDVVLWLRLPRTLCLWGILKRRLRYHGLARPDMADGCRERLNLEFLRYIWTFEQRHAPRLQRVLDDFPAVPVVTLRARRQQALLLQELATAAENMMPDEDA